MGKFGCRLYCWGCGGCCLITGIIMGILSSMIPPSMVASLQEGLFDLAYIDDTSQTEAEGLLADAELPIAESDAFKAWGKMIGDGFDDCMKADFAFDWAKAPEDCVDGLHPTFYLWNATNPDQWGNNGAGYNILQLQEVGNLATFKDVQKIEPDTAYWDETGKARFRMMETYANSNKCSATCEEFSTLTDVLTTNIWYGIFLSIGLGDPWTLAHAVGALPTTNHGNTLKNYLASTEALPMDPHSAIPLPAKSAVRMLDLAAFMATPNAPKLGASTLALGEYANLKQYLWDMGGTLLANMAPAYGTSAKVAPLLVRTSSGGVLGWGAAPAWVDPISSAAFTFNFVGGASGRQVYYGVTPTSYMETQMSSAFYHEGLGYVTQHYELFGGTTTSTHACAWDPDCPADCAIEPTANCVPLAAIGYDGGKIPGLYFGSAKGAPGFAEFKNFILTYYLVITMKSVGRSVIPARYKGPAALENTWNFEGYFVHSSFKAASYNRRLENCDYPTGRDAGGGMRDMPGIDCNFVKDTSPLAPYFGLPLYWLMLPRDFVPEGWDPDLANAGGGSGSIRTTTHVTVTGCDGNRFCSDDFLRAKGPAWQNFLHYGYEPHLGALVDVNLAGGLAWKLTPTSRHAHLITSQGYNFMPIFWVNNYLHLPGAINMDLAKLQGVPAALNGFYIFLLGQCMVSLIGGVACCFCGV